MELPPRINRRDYPIPNLLNLIVGAISIAAVCGCLYWAEHGGNWVHLVLGAVVFSFLNNTLFSLLHEATHGTLHSSRAVNRWFGRIVAAFFPTSFTMQQMYHLGHHRRNRTDAEMFDLYYPGESLALKRFIIYGTVGGIYWASPFVSCILFFIHPAWILSPGVKDSGIMVALSADHMLGGLEKVVARTGVIRGEILLTIAVQASLFYFLGLSFGTWALCYWFFGMNWGSLQYADHVGARRNIREGAWNLKVSPLVRYIFLNYHLHLVHHRHPGLSWIHLPKLVDPRDEMPTYREKLWEFLTGPRPALEPSPELDRDFEKVILDAIQ